MLKGVDVSCHNGFVDWVTLRNYGIDFAICRTGWGKSGVDESFLRNVDGAHDAGLKCGAYHYSYALEPAAARMEAEFCKQIIEDTGVFLELPVFFDMEDADNYKQRNNFLFSKANITAICAAFLDEIKPLNAGVYASFSWLADYIDWQSLNCPVWNAQWSHEDWFRGYMWQFTDRFYVEGNYFDANILYIES